MKIAIKLAAAIFTIAMFLGAGGEEKSILPNGGFDGPATRGIPTGFGWNKYCSLQSAEGIDNSKCVKLISYKYRDIFRSSINMRFQMLQAGEYVFKGSVKGNSFTHAYLVISGKGIKTWLVTFQKNAFSEGQNGWQSFTTQLTIPEGATSISITLEFRFAKADDHVLLDDLSLVRTGTAKAATTVAVRSLTTLNAVPPPANVKISGALVAHPAAVATVSWERPVIAGREYWQMLIDDLWRKTNLAKSEEFVREAGWQCYQTFFTPKSLFVANMRELAIPEIEILCDGRNEAPKSTVSIKAEQGSDILNEKNLNDGDSSTVFFFTADPIPKLKRYKPAVIDISFRFPSPKIVSKVVVYDSSTGTIDSLEFFDASGKKLLPASVSKSQNAFNIEFTNNIPLDVMSIRVTSKCLKHKIDTSEDPVFAKELEHKLFCIIPPYRGGTLFGKTLDNLDIDSYQAFIKHYGKNFLGFDIGEWDSNFFQFKRNGNLGQTEEYSDFFNAAPPRDRDEAEKSLASVFALHREMCFEHFMPHSGALHSQQYACEYGAVVSNIQNSTEQPLFDHRFNTIFGRSAGRQYHVPWGTYLAYHVGPYIPGDNFGSRVSMGYCWGASPSYTLRYFLYCYYMGALFQQYESQNGMISKQPDGSYKLTPNGESVKTMYEWAKSPKGARGDAYTPILMLLDFKHGFINTYRRRGIFYNLPFEDGDYMTEHFLRSFSDCYGCPINKAPYNSNLVNSDVGELCDVYFANPPSGTVASGELGKYAVTILSGKINFTPELVNNLKKYVADGGTLVVNSAYADAFKNDSKFLGLEVLDTWTERNSMKCRNFKPVTATPVMTALDGLTIAMKNSYGKGNVIFTTPRYMMNTANPELPLPTIKQLVKAIADEVAPIKVDGDVLYLFNHMPNGVWKVVLINGKGVEKQPNGSKDIVHQEYAAKVTLTVKDGTNLSAKELYADEPITQNGHVFSLTVPPGSVRVVDIKGVNFRDREVGNVLIGSPDYLEKYAFVRKPAKRKFVPDADPVKIHYCNDYGIFAEYHFDNDNGGIIRDSSGKKTDGKAFNVTYIPDGKGKAVLLSGEKKSFIEIQFPQQFSFREGSIEMRLKPMETSDGNAIFFCTRECFITQKNGQWGLMLLTGGSLVKAVYPQKIEYGKWHHIVLTWNGFTVRFYVDGQEIFTPSGRVHCVGSFFPPFGSLTKPLLYIGTHCYNPGTQGNSRCAYSYFRILGREMSAQEVAERSRSLN